MAHICKSGKTGKGNCKTFKCGSCLNVFTTVCLLHEHLGGMSYTYMHADATCYPLFDFKCTAVKPKVLTLKKATTVKTKSKITEESVQPQLTSDVDDNNGVHSDSTCHDMQDVEVNAQMVDQGSKQLVKCDVCSLVLQRANLKKHALRHSGSRSFVCERCAKSFVTSAELKMHVLCMHERENIDHHHTCDKCSLKFVSKFLLRKHKEKHGDRRFKCHFCLKDFTWGRSLRLHVAKVHDRSYVREFTCYICTERFAGKPELEQHKREKHARPTLPCAQCPRMFKDKGSLRRHMRTHTGDKMYRCNYCQHGFIQINPYYAHMLKRHGIAKHDAYSLHLRMKDKHFDEPLPPSVQEVHSYPQGGNTEVHSQSQNETIESHSLPHDVNIEVNHVPVSEHTLDISQQHIKPDKLSGIDSVVDKVHSVHRSRPEPDQHVPQSSHPGNEQQFPPVIRYSSADTHMHHHQQVGHTAATSHVAVPHHTGSAQDAVPHHTGSVQDSLVYIQDNTHVLYQVENGGEIVPVETRYVQVNNEPIQICIQNGEQINEIRIINV